VTTTTATIIRRRFTNVKNSSSRSLIPFYVRSVCVCVCVRTTVTIMSAAMRCSCRMISSAVAERRRDQKVASLSNRITAVGYNGDNNDPCRRRGQSPLLERDKSSGGLTRFLRFFFFFFSPRSLSISLSVRRIVLAPFRLCRHVTAYTSCATIRNVLVERPEYGRIINHSPKKPSSPRGNRSNTELAVVACCSTPRSSAEPAFFRLFERERATTNSDFEISNREAVIDVE